METPIADLSARHKKKMEEAKVLDFELSEEQARIKHEKWNSNHALYVSNLWASYAKQVRAVHLPFWRFSASVDVQVTKSSAAKKTHSFGYYDVGSPEEIVYEKKNVNYDFNDDDMQIYASYSFRRDFVENLALKTDVTQEKKGTNSKLRNLEEKELDAIAATSELKNVVKWDACSMKPAIAWHLALRNIRKRQLELARQKSPSEDPRNLQVHLKVKGRKAELVYLPAYVLDYAYGTRLNTSQERVVDSFQAMVGGLEDSGVSGERHYSAMKARVVTGGLCVSGFVLDYFGSPLLGMTPFSPELSVTLTFVLGGLSSVAARSAIKMKRREEENKIAETEEESYDYNRLHDESVLQMVEENEWRRWEESEKWYWRDEYRKKWANNLFCKQNKRRNDLKMHYEKLQLQRLKEEEEARRQSARERVYGKQKEGVHSAGLEYQRGVDFMGFYKLLGLEDKLASATEEEIKAAFRREALRLHPDRNAGEKNKKKAEESFKKIQKAYAVLRDPDARVLYHKGQI